MKKAELEEILNQMNCKKGCGDVEIELVYDEPCCSFCGEEAFGQISSAQFNYLKKHCKKIYKEEE